MILVIAEILIILILTLHGTCTSIANITVWIYFKIRFCISQVFRFIMETFFLEPEIYMFVDCRFSKSMMSGQAIVIRP